VLPAKVHQLRRLYAPEGGTWPLSEDLLPRNCLKLFFAITYLVQGLIVRFPKLRKFADPN
jgi:hypothetical protein